MKSFAFLCWSCVTALASLSLPATAGLLEMPETQQDPALERKSVLDSPDQAEPTPDSQAGPNLPVTKIRVQGAAEYPALGITRAALTKQIEAIRFDAAATEEADLVADPEAIAPADPVFQIVEERRRRGVTVGMIQTVADTLTRYYRARGFILAKAYIPEQRVQDGVVTLTLLLGNLGEVGVLNNQNYRAEKLAALAAPLLGKAVEAQAVEERLLLINDLPGVSAQAYFSPGAQVGDTRLNINVLREDRFAGNLRVDNHGSPSTGEYRLYMDGYWHNPGGYGDQLHLGVLSTFEPANSLYGSLHYSFPLVSPRAKVTLGGSTNDFVSDSLSGITLTGKSVVIDAALNYQLLRSRAKNYTAELRLSKITSDIEETTGRLSLAEDELDENVRNLDAVFHFDLLQDNWRALHQGSASLTYGDFDRGRGVFQEQHPLSFGLDYFFLKYLRIPAWQADTRLQLRFAAQYADTSLPSTSQFALAGPSRMRAFDLGQHNADSAAFLSAEWIFQGPEWLGVKVAGAPLGQLLQPLVFWDGGYGDTRDGGVLASTPGAIQLPEQPGSWTRMSDIGAGVRINLRGLRANLSYAYAVSYLRDLGPTFQEHMRDLPDRGKFYFDMQYSF